MLALNSMSQYLLLPNTFLGFCLCCQFFLFVLYINSFWLQCYLSLDTWWKELGGVFRYAGVAKGRTCDWYIPIHPAILHFNFQAQPRSYAEQH